MPREELAWLDGRERMSSVDHRIVLSTPALVSPFLKTHSPARAVQSSCEASRDPRLCRSLRSAKHVRGSRQQLLRPFDDLDGMDAESLGQLDQRLIAFRSRQRYLGRTVPP